MSNCDKFENTDVMCEMSQLEATRREIAFRRQLGGLDAGVRGKNKVSHTLY